MFVRRAVLAVLAASFCRSASAQTDPVEAQRHAAVNQLGTLEYCQVRGFADQQSIEAQQSTLASLHVGGGPSIDAEEAWGRQGTITGHGPRTTIVAQARRQKTSVKSLCGQMAELAKGEADQRRTGAPVTGMPSLPAGIQSSPSMPSIPTIQSTEPGAEPGQP